MSLIQSLFVTESVAVSVIQLILTLGGLITGVMAISMSIFHRESSELQLGGTTLREGTAPAGPLPRWLEERPRSRG
jgi:hypothetical protein